MCAVSSKPLRAPIAVCDLGYLLNKEDAIEHLLAKNLPTHLAHIRSLKALHDATLHPNPTYQASSSHAQGADDEEPPFYCPVATLPMNGRYPFVYIKPTGHVVSQRALKQVNGRLCPITEKRITPDDIIPIHPSDEDRQTMLESLAAKRAAAAEAKRKGKERSAGACSTSGSMSGGLTGSGGSVQPDEGCTTVNRVISSSVDPAAARKAPKAKSTLQAEHSSAATSASASGTKRHQREWEKAVEAKANGSEVYKSLFISAAERKKMEAAEAANFCARGIVPSLSRSTKFGLG